MVNNVHPYLWEITMPLSVSPFLSAHLEFSFQKSHLFILVYSTLSRPFSLSLSLSPLTVQSIRIFPSLPEMSRADLLPKKKEKTSGGGIARVPIQLKPVKTQAEEEPPHKEAGFFDLRHTHTRPVLSQIPFLFFFFSPRSSTENIVAVLFPNISGPFFVWKNVGKSMCLVALFSVDCWMLRPSVSCECACV